MNVNDVEVAVRAFTVPLRPADQKQGRRGRRGKREIQPRDPSRRPPFALVFDCETTVDHTQRLLFGCYRFYALRWRPGGPTLACLEEGLFHADELPEQEPEAMAELTTYAETHAAAVASGLVNGQEPRPDIRLHTRAAFVEKVLVEALRQGATVVAFNAPFDLSRIAVDAAAARKRGYEGGFSLTLDRYLRAGGDSHEDRYLPRVLVRAIDARRARIHLTGIRRGAGRGFPAAARSAVLDLRTLAYALTGESSSLETACGQFGLTFEKRTVTHGQVTGEYIDYCREDVDATGRLYKALAAEYRRWQLDLSPTAAYSPASLAKAYLRQARIRPLLERQPDFPPDVLGQAMVAYYGGRSECRVRSTRVPVCYLDFASMYPTVCVLQGLWRFLQCRRVDVVDDDPAAVEAWLNQLTVDDVFDPMLWPQLCGLALVEPRGDVLPVRARYALGGSYSIGSNPLISDQPLWYTLADLLAARLLGGAAPHVLRAIRFVPQGRTSGLEQIRIRGSRPIDPGREDVFKAMVEERRRQERRRTPASARTAAALKVVANSASYGIFVELNRHEPTARPQPVHVYAHDDFESETTATETPGAYFFAPIGALVSGGARLMLALLETLLARSGGGWAFCDTDSAAVIASEAGGLIPCRGGARRDADGRECIEALSWQQLDTMVERFADLNPYDQQLVPGSILELEDENFHPQTRTRRQLHCYAISAKRYALYSSEEDGRPELVKWSEHALGGFYLNPLDPDQDDRDWTRQAWEGILQSELGGEAPAPSWLHLPALSRFTANKPRLLNAFSALNRGQPYPARVKPFNFLLIAHVAADGYPAGVDPQRFTLAAPYDQHPENWNSLPFFNTHNPDATPFRISTDTPISSTGQPLPPGRVGVSTYQTVLDAYRVNREPKSLAPDGRPCARDTVGLLRRRPVHALRVNAIGKETNLLDEIQAGLIGDQSEALIEYHDLRHDAWTTIESPAIQLLPAGQLASLSGLSVRTVQYARAGRRPYEQHRRARIRAAAVLARQELKAAGIQPPTGDLSCLVILLEHRAAEQTRWCERCGKQLAGRQRRWCAECGASGWRRRS
jgi:hypothetical protein